MLRLLILSLLSVVLTSCAGYTLGGGKPQKYSTIHSLAIPQMENLTLEPRLSVLATNSLVDALAQDGTYRISTSASADAVLHATIREIEYDQFRTNKFDTLASDELSAKVWIEWKLVKNGTTIDSGRNSGKTNFFVADNLHLSRNNALPIAVARATQNIVTSLSEGF